MKPPKDTLGTLYHNIMFWSISMLQLYRRDKLMTGLGRELFQSCKSNLQYLLMIVVDNTKTLGKS